jgi:ankyrin repeat protein
MARSVYKAVADEHPGSIGIILSNLLEKVQQMADELEAPTHVKLTKRMEVLNAGSVYDDYEDPSVHNNIRRSQEAALSKSTFTAVRDLIKMKMNKIKDDHTTKFLFAASRDDVTTIGLMCEHGLDPNTSDYDARTALMVASMKGNTQAVKKLLENHANPNLIDMHGSSALYEAARNGHSEAAQALLNCGAKLCMSDSLAASKLCQAVYDGDVVLLRRLLQAGIPVNASDYDKRSPAHLAAAEGNVAAMKILVEFGADLDLEDRWHNTIDDEARTSNSGPLLAYLGTLERTKKPVDEETQ